MNKIIAALFISFTSQSFATFAPPEVKEDFDGVERLIRLGCGYSFDVWDYINEKMPNTEASVIPAVSQESYRYFVRANDGTWLLTVEWQNPDPTSKDEDIACIIDRGGAGKEQSAMLKPILELPTAIISGRVSVPASKPQHTLKSLL